MKVIMVSERGTEQDEQVADLTAALDRRGHRVCSHRWTPGEDLSGFTTELARLLRHQRPEVVHAHHWTTGLAAVLAAEGTRVPVVQTFHGLGVLDRSGPRDRATLERLVGRHATRVLATSTAQAQRLVDMGVPRRHTSVVPYGVDVQRFALEGPRAPVGQAHRLLAAGRLVPHKGFDLVISALRGLADTELVIVGGPSSGNAEVSRLRRCARHYGVADRVCLLDWVPHERVPELVRSADLVLCTPWRESFGLLALEAMGCGVPVVATPVGGLVDTVVHGVTGVHVPPRKPAELLHVLRGLLADPALREAYGTAGRDRAVVRYSWDRVAADTARVYARCRAAPAPTQELAHT
ncbi:glycosyltransferase [Kutzneria albida]|uniref:Uncharacterized protein n=1 Tax=Kutzneria albida DSM 43870 TaxID=1449976 RepID=W5WBJ8_9PSEU|nr:glycosyltransferase [Kutzneria albida]AHH97921.1 hypothetical protein KALB_4559 [Kutzneria albida DSM 43870]